MPNAQQRRSGATKAFQTAVARGDRAAIARLVAALPALRVEMPGGGPIGRVPPLAAETTVSLVGPEQPLGDDRGLGSPQ